MKDLIGIAKSTAKEYPMLKSDIEELVELCIMEIEEGGSESHEIELCLSSIQDLVSQHYHKQKITRS